MKQVIKKTSLPLLFALLILPASLLAQKEDKGSKDKKDAEQIIITRKGNTDEKIVVEVNGDKVLVNGKELNEGDKDADISVRRHKIKDVWAYGVGNQAMSFNNVKGFNMDENRAMLGVTTEKADEGTEVQSVTKESGAEKAGLKEGDIITKVDDKKIEDPDDLSAAIKTHKPGDKVSVTYLRDKKEQKATAELSKWKGVNVYTFSTPNGGNFNFNMKDMNMGEIMPHLPRVQGLQGVPGLSWNWNGNGPKLGLSVQDTEDGNGVAVLGVDEDGNAAKAGIKEEDVITEVDGKAVNSADEIAKLMRDNKEKTSVKVKLLRKGKAENVEVKIPRKLKTADL